MAGVFVEVPHGRVFGKVHVDALFYCICNNVLKKNTGVSAVGPRPAQLLGRFVEQGDPFVTQQFGGLPLGFFPGWNRFLD